MHSFMVNPQLSESILAEPRIISTNDGVCAKKLMVLYPFIGSVEHYQWFPQVMLTTGLCLNPLFINVLILQVLNFYDSISFLDPKWISLKVVRFFHNQCHPWFLIGLIHLGIWSYCQKLVSTKGHVMPKNKFQS